MGCLESEKAAAVKTPARQVAIARRRGVITKKALPVLNDINPKTMNQSLLLTTATGCGV